MKWSYISIWLKNSITYIINYYFANSIISIFLERIKWFIAVVEIKLPLTEKN